MLLGLILNGLGSGLLIPTLLAMTMERLPFELRGRGMGIYMGAFFIGQFVSPIVVTVLAKQAGGLLGAIAVFGYVGFSAGLAGIAVLYRNRAFRVPLERIASVPHSGNVGTDVDKLTT
jgi:MFS family permease